MPNLYRSESSNPKWNAQRNLQGRTHYVDDDTLRFHKSRVISSRHTDGGLLFAIVTSDAKDYENRKRGFRYVIFDLFGNVVDRNPATADREWFSSSERATDAMWNALNKLDASAITREAALHARQHFNDEMLALEQDVAKLVDGGYTKPLTPPAEHLAGIRQTLEGIK